MIEIRENIVRNQDTIKIELYVRSQNRTIVKFDRIFRGETKEYERLVFSSFAFLAFDNSSTLEQYRTIYKFAENKDLLYLAYDFLEECIDLVWDVFESIKTFCYYFLRIRDSKKLISLLWSKMNVENPFVGGYFEELFLVQSRFQEFVHLECLLKFNIFKCFEYVRKENCSGFFYQIKINKELENFKSGGQDFVRLGGIFEDISLGDYENLTQLKPGKLLLFLLAFMFPCERKLGQLKQLHCSLGDVQIIRVNQMQKVDVPMEFVSSIQGVIRKDNGDEFLLNEISEMINSLINILPDPDLLGHFSPENFNNILEIQNKMIYLIFLFFDYS